MLHPAAQGAGNLQWPQTRPVSNQQEAAVAPGTLFASASLDDPAANGGPSETMAIAPGSAAIDAGVPLAHRGRTSAGTRAAAQSISVPTNGRPIASSWTASTAVEHALRTLPPCLVERNEEDASRSEAKPETRRRRRTRRTDHSPKGQRLRRPSPLINLRVLRVPRVSIFQSSVLFPAFCSSAARHCASSTDGPARLK